MKKNDDAEAVLKKLLAGQPLGALATCGGEGAYVNLVAFAPAENFREVFFCTPRSTRKFENLAANRRAALLIDSRSNRPADLHRAAAVTAVGRTAELKGAARKKARVRYLSRHPHLQDFVDAPTTALIRLEVSTYVLVRDFQRVDLIEIDR